MTLKKPIIIGISVLVLDYLAHSYIANPETTYYFLAKPIISGYVAYYMYENKWNFLKLGFKTTPFYIYYSLLFASIHGIYYRILELIQGNPLFSRIDITIGNFVFNAKNLIETIIGWAIIHGGAFFIGILIAENFVKND